GGSQGSLLARVGRTQDLPVAPFPPERSLTKLSSENPHSSTWPGPPHVPAMPRHEKPQTHAAARHHLHRAHTEQANALRRPRSHKRWDACPCRSASSPPHQERRRRVSAGNAPPINQETLCSQPEHF